MTGRCRPGPCRGFTLAEALVAMTMFTIITAATTFAITAALRGYQKTQERNDQTQEARILLGRISRDFRQAYASLDNPDTYFVAQGADTGPVVQFTALTHRVQVPLTDTQDLLGSAPQVTPQSGLSLISYYLDSESGTLSRSETSVPNPDLLPDPSAPSTAISDRVVSLALEFLDADGNVRTDWDFTNDQAAQASGQSASPTDTTTGQGTDTTLPQAVHIQLSLARQNGPPVIYSTTVTLVTPEPQEVGQKPASATGTGAGTPGSGNNGGNNLGDNNGTNGGLPGLPGTGVRP